MDPRRRARPTKDDLTVHGLEVLPGNRQLKVGQEQQLLVRASFSDGSRHDVTWVTQFTSNDSSVADVSPGGLVKMVREGETAVAATYQGQVAVVMVAAPHAKIVATTAFAQKNNFIDEHVFKKLADLNIEPSPLANDDVFLRRVYLDTIGVTPTPDEVRAFAADNRADKRSRVIELHFRAIRIRRFLGTATWRSFTESTRKRSRRSRRQRRAPCTNGSAIKWRSIGPGTKW